jgi:uncharacterized protein YegL
MVPEDDAPAARDIPDPMPVPCDDRPSVALSLSIDTSASMAGEPLKQVLAGLVELQKDIVADVAPSVDVSVAVHTFGGEVKIGPFQKAVDFEVPDLKAQGRTPMCECINACDSLMVEYRHQCAEAKRPLKGQISVIVTDGMPTDDEETIAEATARILAAENAMRAMDRVMYLAVGTESADFSTLRRIFSRPPLLLQDMRFIRLFRWLAGSMKQIGRSQANDDFVLPSPKSAGLLEMR